MTVKKVRTNKWVCGDYTITCSHDKIKGLHPKYYVSNQKDHFYASTLKEAKEIIEFKNR